MTAPDALRAPRACARCGTELAANALACPNCHALVHAERLRILAARGEREEGAGNLLAAREAWDEALALLPAQTQQHQQIAARLAALAARITDDADAREEAAKSRRAGMPLLKRWGAGVGAFAVLVLTKGKFLLLGITKLPTLLSMLSFMSIYWAMFGWALAVGLVLAIYVHEMGHVWGLLRIGIRPNYPMFIPGVGAFVSWSSRITDPRADAMVSLAGPVWGAGAALAAFIAGSYLMNDTLLAIAKWTGILNLANLLPVMPFDGWHGYRVLGRVERALVAATFGGAALLSGFPLLWIPTIVAAVLVFRRPAGPGDPKSLATFMASIAVLTWFARIHVASAVLAPR